MSLKPPYPPCRICKTNTANSSGYCSPCRNRKYKGKPCTSCGKPKQGQSPQCKSCQNKRRSKGTCRRCGERCGGHECSKCVTSRKLRKCRFCKCQLTNENKKNCWCCLGCEQLSAKAIAARTKVCRKCGHAEFANNRCTACGTYWHNHGQRKCKMCSVSVNSPRVYCTDCSNLRNLAFKYNITIEQALAIKAKPCEICNDRVYDQDSFIDHCHETGDVRGGLCMNCNFAIGRIRDSVAVLESMVFYIDSPRTPIIHKDGFYDKIHKPCRKCACGNLKPDRARSCRQCLRLRDGMTFCNSCLTYTGRGNPTKTSFCGTCARLNVAKSNYDLSEVGARVITSIGQCDICKSNSQTVVDHCHSTGIVRGAICGHCNTALGLFCDSTDVIRKAIVYLKSKSRVV